METRREVDVLMSRENLRSRVTDYTAGQDAALGLISPVFADLSGLPPLIIQAGTHEVLLDDAVRLARQAATADVEVTLDITPRVAARLPGLLPLRLNRHGSRVGGGQVAHRGAEHAQCLGGGGRSWDAIHLRRHLPGELAGRSVRSKRSFDPVFESYRPYRQFLETTRRGW